MLSPPFPVAHSVLQSLGTRVGIPGAHPHAPRTAHHHFAHCLFTLHMSPRRERWKIKCIYTVTTRGAEWGRPGGPWPLVKQWGRKEAVYALGSLPLSKRTRGTGHSRPAGPQRGCLGWGAVWKSKVHTVRVNITCGGRKRGWYWRNRSDAPLEQAFSGGWLWTWREWAMISHQGISARASPESHGE